MKRLLCLALLLMFASLASGQAAKIPTCNSWNAGTAQAPSGVPVYSASNTVPDPSGSTNCTDYFGVANWANSPLPTGTITGYTVLMPGSGYTAPTVQITDPLGATITTAGVTFDPISGGITGITGGTGGAGYISPIVTISDPTGSGAMVSAVLGAPFLGGMPKFQAADTLGPQGGLTFAVPDQTTFPNSDYYVIGLMQYTQRLHSSLPATTLRGYCQLNLPAPNTGVCTPSYLGPVILAAKGRAVRVLFKNMLNTVANGGNLFIPVDTTYMGADRAQNRATLHLHGGNTPWISDGTTMQWTTPAGESVAPLRGESVSFVPDMWFDAASGYALIAACAGQPTCPSVPTATNDPGTGNLTFFWTNQQGGRLMFYHDHAYGITRLNVYAGEAAGYLLIDPQEEHTLAGSTAPGTLDLTQGGVLDLAHVIPLVIQDKTFVPGPAQLKAEDPTWAGNFGATPLDTVNGLPNGDLWFPHVYTTNQNPADPSGGNAYGRWDYGAWFFPPMTSLTAANPPSAVTIPCTTSAFPGAVLAPLPANNGMEGCPIIQNPSGTPEGFMDTPLVNGKAYPVLHVSPAAYRMYILAAGNDRSWNLQLYVADPNGYKDPVTGLPTEVAMLPAAIPPAGGLPLCTQINPTAVPSLGIGLVTALLDPSGNPLNNTGLQAGCWPNYGSIPGIPSKQTMWAADGRAGGAPDPTKAGPPFIQIGTEGGLLPAPVVIPSTPSGYEWNPRSITITNVGAHGLWLGPAERADVIVDFSKYNGQTLILYNDAPTPAPGFDSRLDYFTGDGDQTAIGGAPNTPPGFGPNTRTIMQIVVDGGDNAGPNLVPFSLATLRAAFATTPTQNGLFKTTQPTVIVPETAYNSAYNLPFTNTYGRISDNNLTFTPINPLLFEALVPSGKTCNATPPAQCAVMDQKAIQELFTLDYGRMNATLGTELPLTNFQNQTTIPLGYVDPATEILKDGDTQIWKITHNGVDTHFIHFHLVNVQVINRIGWDGSIRPIDANETGWKDTVRMNPLEDIIVAMQSTKQNLPFPIPNSIRLMDVTMANGPDTNITNINPFTGAAGTQNNTYQNFGWEYVWHCHILGHEENDMMRPIVFQVPPPAPSGLVAAALQGGGVQLSWIDNSASETGFVLQRDTDPNFVNPAPTVINVGPSTPTNLAGEGTSWGGTINYADTDPSLQAGTNYYYRVQAIDDGFSVSSGMAQPFNATPALLSAWSNPASILAAPIASITPATLAFGNVVVGSISAPQSVTLSNTGTAPLDLGLLNPNNGILVTGSAAFASTNTCGTSLGVGASCVISVTFAPTAVGPVAGSVVVTSNDPAHSPLTVSLSGTGTSNTAIAITAPAINYGADGVVTLVVSAPGGTPTGNVTLSVDGGTPVSLALDPTGSATFNSVNTPALLAPSVPSHTLTANYAAQGLFLASTATGTLTVNPATLTVTPSPNPATMTYGGTVPALTPNIVGFVLGQTNAVLTAQPTCTTTATSTSPVGSYTSGCAGGAAANYTFNYVPGTVNVTAAALTITASNGSMTYGGTVPTITPSFSGFVNGDTALTALSTQPTCTTTATATSPVSPPTYPSNCSGAVAANYTITYVAGAVTVNPAVLTVTASNGTMTYGGTVPTITPIYSGFVNGQNASVVTTPPTCTTTATPTSNVGSYPSNCSGGVAPNYTLSYVPGTVTVTAAPLLITASNGSMAYGQAVPPITPIYSGFVNGQNSSVLTSQPICTTTATSASPVGSYPSSCSGAAAVNYQISYAPGTVTIVKATTATTLSNVPPSSSVGQVVTMNFGVVPQFSQTPTGTVTVTASTGESCSNVLSAGAGSCTITFFTGGTRTLTATYAGDSNFTGSTSAPVTQVVSGLSLSNSSLTFGNQLVGTISAPQTVTVSNVGGTTVNISNITWSANFSDSSNCIGNLAPGRNCRINVRFAPTTTGVLNGTLTITTSIGTLTVTLSGTGVAPINSVSPTSLAFGNQRRNTTSPPQTVVVTNTGTAPLNFTSIRIAGGNANQFAISNNSCPASLAAGANCTVSVVFKPTSVGNKVSSLGVNVAAPATSVLVQLTGTGQ